MSKSRSSPKTAVRTRILETAASIFSTKGFSASSLQDIADALNLTRPAIYYYFGSKEEILHALVEDDAQVAALFIADIRSQPGEVAAVRFHGAVKTFVCWILERREIFRIMERLDDDLPEPVVRAQRQAKRQVLKEFTDLIAEGVESGALSKTENHRTAALAIIGMCTWSAWWYNSDKDGTVEAVAEFIAALASRMFSTEAACSALDRKNYAAALARMQQDLAVLGDFLD